ncbi:MAG: hypothetical protein ABSD46_01745 [Bacteroidota bacterium]
MVNRLYILLTLFLLINLNGQAQITFPYIEGACPFECCQFGRWITRSPLDVYNKEGDTSSLLFNICPGDTLTALNGYLHITRPGLVVVKKTIDTLQIGDTLLVLGYFGEGTYSAYYKKSEITVTAFWPDPYYAESSDDSTYAGRMLVSPQMTWWVNIEDRHARKGWIRLVNRESYGMSFNEQIEGMDSCDPPPPNQQLKLTK